MAIVFGELATDGAGATIENGMYAANISAATVVMENNAPKKNDNGKNLVEVYFKIDDETTVKRRYSVSYQKNTANQTWAAWALMIQAVTGVSCGTEEQRKVSDQDLIGKPCRIVVAKNDRGYMDVGMVLAPERGQKTKPMPLPQPAADEIPDDEIPF